MLIINQIQPREIENDSEAGQVDLDDQGNMLETVFTEDGIPQDPTDSDIFRPISACRKIPYRRYNKCTKICRTPHTCRDFCRTIVEFTRVC